MQTLRKRARPKPKTKSINKKVKQYICPKCQRKALEGVKTQSGTRACPICLVQKSMIIELKKATYKDL
jgi:rubrerythrin